ncbi:MAG: molybdenum cofactor biosynthesis protein B [Thermomicrobiales bacterium]
MSQSVEEHREAAPDSIVCAVVTVSDSRDESSDRSGRIMIDSLEKAGHRIALYRIVRDEPSEIEDILAACRAQQEIQAVLFNGGTGIASRDTTFDVVSRAIDKELPGFGELFRMLSWDEIGPAAMLSRATAGVFSGRLLFSTPGSSNAVRLAMDKLIIPELGHLVYEVTK